MTTTLEHVAHYCGEDRYPGFGELFEDELNAALGIEPQMSAAAEIQVSADADTDVSVAPRTEEPKPPKPKEPDDEEPWSSASRDELLATIADYEAQLHEARQEYTDAARGTKAARGKLSEAIMLWQTGGEKLTPEQNVRNYIRSNQERKAALAAGLIEPPQRQQPRGVVTRTAAYGVGGDASDFARKGMRTGFRRGGMTATQAAHVNAEQRRVAAQAAPKRKLPSER